MADKDGREAGDDDDSWVTVGARPRQKAAPPPAAALHNTGASRKKRPEQPAAAKRSSEPKENDWHLVMRSRQALTKLRDEDFALTRLGQIHAGEPRRAEPRPANRSRLGAKFPMSMASDRPNRPVAVLRRPARLAMPKFDVPLRSEADFPSLRGEAEPAAPPPAATERRRSSVALKLDESLRSMAGAAAQQGEAAAAAPPPTPPPLRTVAYSEAVSWRAKPARKSERRDLVRGDIREDVAMLQTAPVQTHPAESPAAAAAAATGSAAAGDTPQKKKEKEKRALKKAKKKESQLILARMNASKDTHVQLVTADAFERLHGAHAGRWRRSQAETVDLRAADQYPSLEETAASAAAQDASPQQQQQLSDRSDGGVKTYSRMLRELPKTLPAPRDVKEVAEAKETKETKRKNPKKRAPIETSLIDLAERMPAARPKRVDGVRVTQKARRPVQLARIGGNRLDSAVLVHKRGKERLKKKKPSLLKRVILRERAERRRRSGMEAGSAALALLAGLTVKEEEEGEGQQVKRETDGRALEAVGEKVGSVTAQLAAPPVSAQPAPVTSAPVAIQASTSPKQNTIGAPKRAGITPAQPSGTTHKTQTVSVVEAVPAVKQEPIDSSATQKAASGTDQKAAPELVEGKPRETSGPAPVGSTGVPQTAAAVSAGDADSDEDVPPSRGPDYTPSVSVDPKLLIHSRKFREYCQHTLSGDIDETARLLLQDLTRFQDRLYNRDPIKARSRRRLVYGLREVSKHLAIKKLACVILAPNIEKIETEGGLDQAVQRLLTLASEREVPLVFALKRRALGHACKKPVPVSCVGIFNYQGSEDNYKRLMQLTEAAQERYRGMLSEVEQALRPQPEPEQSAAGQLLGVFDRISQQAAVAPPPVSAAPQDDPTHTLLAKLRAVTLGGQVSGLPDLARTGAGRDGAARLVCDRCDHSGAV